MICVQTERFHTHFWERISEPSIGGRESFPCFSKKNNIILEAIDPLEKREPTKKKSNYEKFVDTR